MPRIVVGADVVPVNRTLDAFMRGDAQAIFGDLLPLLQSANFSIVNLECPLIVEPSPAPKSGPTLGAPVASIRGIRNAGIHALGLANNHILDHGPQGLRSTLDACREVGFDTVGAGENLEAAGRLLIREVGGVRVAVLAIAEHECSIAGRDSPGANPIDPVTFMRTVRRHKGLYDFLLVLFHGGSEHHPYPSPRVMDMCRLLVEEGAGAVLVQHTHCPGCWERYEGAYIVYGQGNLVFDKPGISLPLWHEGFLVVLDVASPSDVSMTVVPYTQGRDRPGARRLRDTEESDFLDALRARSKLLADREAIERKWQEYCATMEGGYLNILHGHGWLLRKLNNRLHWLSRLYTPAKRRVIQNCIRCESIREVLETILGEETPCGRG